MDEETLARYSKTYSVSVDDIRAWFAGLDADTQPIVAECFRRGSAPTPRDGDDWVQQYRRYDAALSSFSAFVAERWTELLAGAVS